jgi:integrase
MAVKIRKLRGKWYLVIDHKGKRKTKAIGASKAVAEEVRRNVELQLANSELGCFGEPDGQQTDSFDNYSKKWLRDHGQNIKNSTDRSYEQLLRLHVTPRFGQKRLGAITRDDVKEFLSDLAERTKKRKDGSEVSAFSRNTIRLILSALRAVLSAAWEDKLIPSNPASKVGKFNKKEKGQAKAQAMTRAESDKFLESVLEICPKYYALFFTALRAGLRKGELIALKWGDIQFGESEDDSNRFILVQRNYYLAEFITPKNHECRRVDMSKQLRAVLLMLRDERLLAAFQNGKTSIADDLAFPSEAGTPLFPDNIAPRYMEPALQKAGLRKFRFHDLRHTFGSLLIQAGVSPAYVQKQMGHKSIQVTVDTYGHLIPGENVAWIDQIDSKSLKTAPQESANRTQTPSAPQTAGAENVVEAFENKEEVWLPPRDLNPDMLIQRLQAGDSAGFPRVH